MSSSSPGWTGFLIGRVPDRPAAGSVLLLFGIGGGAGSAGWDIARASSPREACLAWTPAMDAKTRGKLVNSAVIRIREARSRETHRARDAGASPAAIARRERARLRPPHTGVV